MFKNIDVLVILSYIVGMKITVFNLKGGQGKTTISLSLALLRGFLVVTNDEYSPIDKVLPKGHVKHLKQGEALPSVPDSVNIIYDFGGHPDFRVIEAAKQSDWVIVPIVYDSPLDMQTAIKTIREVETHNKHIVIVINRTKKGDLDKARKVLDQFFNHPVFEVKQSTAFIKMVEKKKSIKDLMKDSYLFGYHYKLPHEQIEAINDFVS